MDPVASSARSIEAINSIMQMANSESLKQAEKLIKVNLEMSLSKELGKGQNIDLVA